MDGARREVRRVITWNMEAPMVSSFDGNEHDHGHGDVCPGCRFREALASFLSESFNHGREEWHWAVGDVRRHMHAALLALDAVEARPYDVEPDPDAAADAAAAITLVGSEIQQLARELLDHDGQADDQRPAG
jgi:hypothetical protein